MKTLHRPLAVLTLPACGLGVSPVRSAEVKLVTVPNTCRMTVSSNEEDP